jgi:hypothetical protein
LSSIQDFWTISNNKTGEMQTQKAQLVKTGLLRTKSALAELGALAVLLDHIEVSYNPAHCLNLIPILRLKDLGTTTSW